MIPNSLKVTVLVAANQGVLAGLVGVFPCLKLFFCHVGRVEASACRFCLIAWDEDAAVVKLIPWTIVDFRVFTGVRVFDAAQKLVFIAIEVLCPVNVVHNLTCFEKKREHFYLIFREMADVGCQSHLRILVGEGLVVFLATAAVVFLFATAYQCCHKRYTHSYVSDFHMFNDLFNDSKFFHSCCFAYDFHEILTFRKT